MDPVLRMRCEVQQYAWGKLGAASAVAQLAQAGNTDFKLDADKPYAELWMGTHAKAPSKVVLPDDSVITLSEALERYPELSKGSVTKAGQLPYLFKVLSVDKTLSIQAHPDKKLAEALHARDPEHYPDDNHKPEMAIAITPFMGMCGFREPEEIAKFLKTIHELRAVVGADAADAMAASLKNKDAVKESLAQLLGTLMRADTTLIATQLSALESRLKTVPVDQRDETTQFVLRLADQYPGDVGVFCLYLLNIVTLQPGEAMFLGPNLPHAYIDGDCIECMACSDNVVRAGCTPKFKDVPTLVDMLTYETGGAKKQLFPSAPHPEEPRVSVYNPPVPDFTVAGAKVEPMTSMVLPAEQGPSIVLIQGGAGAVQYKAGGEDKALDIVAGHVLFVAAQEAVTIAASKEAVQLYRAYV